MLPLHGRCMLALWARSCADFLSKIVFSLCLVQRVFYLFLRPEASTVVKYDNVFKLTITWRYFFLDKFLCRDFPVLCADKRQQYNSYLLSVLFNLFYGNPSSRITVMHLNWDIWSQLCWKGNIKMTEARQSIVWTSSSSLVLKSFVQDIT